MTNILINSYLYLIKSYSSKNDISFCTFLKLNKNKRVIMEIK